MTARPSYAVVVLTMGNRPAEMLSAVESIRRQVDVDVDIVVVGNGWSPVGLPGDVKTLGLQDNLGIPAGRNAGVPTVSGDLLFFLDDDAALVGDDFLARLAATFAQEPSIGLIQPRVVARDGGPAPRRWTPRLRVGDPARSSDVAALWEGAIGVRRAVFDEVGGWADPFFYAHEGIDLAWAVWAAGHRVRYCGDLEVSHPNAAPTRHAELYRLSARNRVFVARRRLPALLAAVYLLVWIMLTLGRVRGVVPLSQSWQGFREGLREDAGPRRPMSWRTAWRLTKAGRPPII